MTQKCETPAYQAGARDDLLGGWSLRYRIPNQVQGQCPAVDWKRLHGGSAAPFTNHRAAALALLNQFPTLSHIEAGFLGQVCVAHVASQKQIKWLLKILAQKRLPLLEVV